MTREHRKLISIVSPCYNEELNVEACHEAVKELFEGELSGYDREHIFVDNGSTDSTVEILRRLAASDPSVKVVVNSRNFGVYKSTFNALRHATGDATLAMLPVDLQDPPEMLIEFIRLWEDGYEVIAGARSTREEGLIMRKMRKSFYRIVNRLSEFEIPLDVGEFVLLDRKPMEALLRYNDQYPYIRGIIASLGFKRIIVPYVWKARERGKSNFNVLQLFDAAMNGIFAFTRAPMRAATIAGFLISFASFAFAIFSVVMYFLDPNAPRGTTTIITAIFFLSGVQLSFIGILGEYITTIHNQVRGAPMVIERELINFEDDKGVNALLDAETALSARGRSAEMTKQQ